MIEKPAETSAPVHDLIRDRWSPRALAPDTTLTWDTLRGLAEAARWAPSYGNTQPARYLMGLRGDDSYRRIFDTLADGNKNWAANAAALLIGVAVQRNAKGEIPYAEYGLGLATQNLVLQAVAAGYVAHQMAGFDAEAVRASFGVPAEATPLVAIAIGGGATADVLPAEKRERELAPRSRLDLADIAFSDTWGTPAF